MNFEEAANHIKEVVEKNSTISNIIKNPKGACKNAAEKIVDLLANEKIACDVGAMQLFKGIGESAGNHYIVIAKYNNFEVYVDVTAAQFESSKKPIYASERDWKKQFFRLTEISQRGVLFKRSNSIESVRSFMDDINPSILKDGEIIKPGGKQLQRAIENPASMIIRDGINSTSVSGNSHKKENATRLVKDVLLDKDGNFKKEIQATTLQPDVIGQVSRALPDGANISNFSEQINICLDAKKNGYEKSKAVIVAMIELDIVAPAQKYQKRKRKFMNELASYFVQLDAINKDNMRNMFLNLPSSDALSTKSVMDKNGGWETPITEDIIGKFIKENDSKEKYNKRFIIQLESDDISYNAAKHLFLKDPLISSWVQYKNTSLENGYRWDGANRKLAYERLSFVPENEGTLNVTLVGHGRDSGKIFGELKANDVKEILRQFQSAFNDPKVNSIKLDFVGCELVPANKFSSTLIADVLNWLVASNGMDVRHRKLIAIGSQYPVRITESGKKQYYITGSRGWVDSSTAVLSDFTYKNEIRWNHTMKNWDVGYPRGYFDKLMAFTTFHLSGYDVDKKSGKTVVDYLVKTQLQIIDEKNNFMKSISDLRLKNGYVTFSEIERVDGGFEMKFYDMDGKTKRIPVLQNDVNAIATFKSRIDNLTDQVRRNFEVTNDAKSFTKLNTISNVSSSALNALFFLKTLLDGNLWGESDTQTKVLIFSGLTAQGPGFFADAAQLANFIQKSASLSWRVGTNVIEALQKFGLAAGIITDAISLIYSVQVLVNNTDLDKTARLATDLAFNIVTAGLSAAAIAASIVGSTALATVLGVIGIPVAGLGLGLSYVLMAIESNKQRFRKLTDDFSNFAIDTTDLLEKNRGFARFKNAYAVVNKIDFIKNEVELGEVLISPTEVAPGHFKIGDWWDHVIARGTKFSTKKENYLDLYDGLRISKKMSVDFSGSHSLILPCAPTTYITFTYDHAAGLRWIDASLFQKLNEYYGNRFIWGYFCGRDIVISEIRPLEKVTTSVHVNLDANECTLYAPIGISDDTAQKLKYYIVGGGGKCTLHMFKSPIYVNLKSDNKNNNDIWEINFDNWNSANDGYVPLKEFVENLVENKEPGSIRTRSGPSITFTGIGNSYELRVNDEIGATIIVQKKRNADMRCTIKFRTWYELLGDINTIIKSFAENYEFPEGFKIYLSCEEIEDFGSYEVGSAKVEILLGSSVYSSIDYKLFQTIDSKTKITRITRTDGMGKSPVIISLPEAVTYLAGTSTDPQDCWIFEGAIIKRYYLSRGGKIILPISCCADQAVQHIILEGNSLRIIRVSTETLVQSELGETFWIIPHPSAGNYNLVNIPSPTDDRNLLRMTSELINSKIYFWGNKASEIITPDAIPYVFDINSRTASYVFDVKHISEKIGTEINPEDIDSCIQRYGLGNMNLKIENSMTFRKFIISGDFIAYSPLHTITTDRGVVLKWSPTYTSFLEIIKLPSNWSYASEIENGTKAICNAQGGWMDDGFQILLDSDPQKDITYDIVMASRNRTKRDISDEKLVKYDFVSNFKDEISHVDLTLNGIFVYGRSGIVYDGFSKQPIGGVDKCGTYVSFNNAVLKNPQDFKIEEMQGVSMFENQMILEGVSGLLYSIRTYGQICIFGKISSALNFTMSGGPIPLDERAKLISQKDNHLYVDNGNSLIQFNSTLAGIESKKFRLIEDRNYINRYFQSENNQLKHLSTTASISSFHFPESLQKIMQQDDVEYLIGYSGQAYRILKSRYSPYEILINLSGFIVGEKIIKTHDENYWTIFSDMKTIVCDNGYTYLYSLYAQRIYSFMLKDDGKYHGTWSWGSYSAKLPDNGFLISMSSINGVAMIDCDKNCGLIYMMDKNQPILCNVDVKLCSAWYGIEKPNTLAALNNFMINTLKPTPGYYSTQHGYDTVGLKNMTLYGSEIKSAWRKDGMWKYLTMNGLFYQYQNQVDCLIGKMACDGSLQMANKALYITGNDYKIGIEDGKFSCFQLGRNIYDKEFNQILISFQYYTELSEGNHLLIHYAPYYVHQGARFVVSDGRLKLYDIDLSKMSPLLNPQHPDDWYYEHFMCKYPLKTLGDCVKLDDDDYVIIRDSSESDKFGLKSEIDRITESLHKKSKSYTDRVIGMAFIVQNACIRYVRCYITRLNKLYDESLNEIGIWQEGKIISEKNFNRPISHLA